MTYKNYSIDCPPEGHGMFRLRPQWSVSANSEVWFTSEKDAKDWVDDSERPEQDENQGRLF